VIAEAAIAEDAIAEGMKPLTIRGYGERRKLTQRGLGRIPRNRRDFEHLMPKWSTFWDVVNLIFLTIKLKNSRT